jgi:hypothetical protein
MQCFMSSVVHVPGEAKPADQIKAGDWQQSIYERTPERHNAEDVVKEISKKACPKLEHILSKNKDIEQEYYVVLWLKIDPLLPSIVQQWWMGPLLFRPAPEFNWSLFSYSNKDECLRHHWTIPDLETSMFMLHNARHIPKEDKELLRWVQEFHAGTLV